MTHESTKNPTSSASSSGTDARAEADIRGRYTDRAESSAAEQSTAEKIEAEVATLGFSINTSLRYHASRRFFFGNLDLAAKALSALTGSAAFAALLGGATTYALWASGIVAVIQSFDLAVGFSSRAAKYDDLYRRFSRLAVEIVRHPPSSVDVTLLRNWMAERVIIEGDEPTPIDALNVIFHNIEAEARGYGIEHQRRVYWYQRLFAQFLTLPPNNFPPKAR